MIIRVLAPALSHLRPALRLAGPAGPVIGLQGRRDARAAVRDRGAATDPSPALDRLGRAGGGGGRRLGHSLASCHRATVAPPGSLITISEPCGRSMRSRITVAPSSTARRPARSRSLTGR